jgi:hypothetical protein
MTIIATTRATSSKNHWEMPIWRDFCVSALSSFSLENWSKKHHMGILIGSCIRGGRYE